MNPLKIAGDLAKQLSDHRASQGPKPEGAKPGPEGPKHRPVQEPDEVHMSDIGELEHVLCPNCHANLKKHLISKAAGHESSKPQDSL